MKVYKVVREDNGKYVSVYADGDAKITYPIGEVVYRPQAPVIAFDNIKDAIEFSKRCGPFIDLSIFEAEADTIAPPPIRLNTSLISKEGVDRLWQDYLWCRLVSPCAPRFWERWDFWPKGTIACLCIRLDRKIPYWEIKDAQ
jgi:hypothetical protein